MGPLDMAPGISIPRTWDFGYPPLQPPDMGPAATGGHHWRPVQTCSLEDSHRPWYRHLVVTTETRTVGDRAIRILLECCLLEMDLWLYNIVWSVRMVSVKLSFSSLPENTFLQWFGRVNSCNFARDVISRIHLGEPAVKRWRLCFWRCHGYCDTNE